jgi:hypothetical protein
LINATGKRAGRAKTMHPACDEIMAGKLRMRELGESARRPVFYFHQGRAFLTGPLKRPKGLVSYNIKYFVS